MVIATPVPKAHGAVGMGHGVSGQSFKFKVHSEEIIQEKRYALGALREWHGTSSSLGFRQFVKSLNGQFVLNGPTGW
jgi:hypothetical protein